MDSIDSVNLSAPRPRPPSVRVRLNQPSYTAGEGVILTVHIENRSAHYAGGRQRDYSQQQQQQQQYQRGDYGADGSVQLESLSVEVKGVIRSASAPRADTTWSCAGDQPCLVARPLRLAIHAPLDPGSSKCCKPLAPRRFPSPSLLLPLSSPFFSPLFSSRPPQPTPFSYSRRLVFSLLTSLRLAHSGLHLSASPFHVSFCPSTRFPVPDTIEIPLPSNALPSGRMAGNDSFALPLSLPLDDDATDLSAHEPASATVLYLVSVSADWCGISELLAWFKVKAAAGISHGPANAAFNPACPPCARLSAHESPSGGPSAALAPSLSAATALASPSYQSPFRLPHLTTPIASAFPGGSSLPPTPTATTPSPASTPLQSRRLLPHLSAPREGSHAPSRAPPCPDDVEAVSVATVLPCDVSSSSRFGAWGWAQGQGNGHGASSNADESCIGNKHMREAEADESAAGAAMAAAAAHAVHGLAHVPEGFIVAHSSGSGSSNSSWGAVAGGMGGRGMVRSSTTGQVAEWGGGAGGSELVGIAEAVTGVVPTGSAVAGVGARGMRRSCSDDDGMRGHGRGGKGGPMWGSGGSAEEAEGGEAEGENTYSSSSGSSAGWGTEEGSEEANYGNSRRTMSLPASRRLPSVPVEGLLAPEHEQEFPRQLLLQPQHIGTLPPLAPHSPRAPHTHHADNANFGNHTHHGLYPVCRGPDCQHTSCDAMPIGSPADCLNWKEVEAFCRNMDSARVRIESIDIQHESRNKNPAPHGVRSAAKAGFRTKAMHGEDGDGEGGEAEEGQGEQEQENGKRREREEVAGMEACSRVLFAVKFQGMSLWHYPATDSVKPLFRMAS
ncbi:unnamed protein product [Closterium sp. NIES-64]|nr:unnamed protein product [Closterium sp. NIES-64]